MLFPYEWTYQIRFRITNFLIWAIGKVNPGKNNMLSYRLHELAGMYQRRPQEGWKPPEDWDCWKED